MLVTTSQTSWLGYRSAGPSSTPHVTHVSGSSNVGAVPDVDRSRPLTKHHPRRRMVDDIRRDVVRRTPGRRPVRANGRGGPRDGRSGCCCTIGSGGPPTRPRPPRRTPRPPRADRWRAGSRVPPRHRRRAPVPVLGSARDRDGPVRTRAPIGAGGRWQEARRDAGGERSCAGAWGDRVLTEARRRRGAWLADCGLSPHSRG